MVLLVLVSGLLAGFLSGLLGLGGGILLAPILLYAPQAVGLSSFPVKEIIGLTMTQRLARRLWGCAAPLLWIRVVVTGGINRNQCGDFRPDWRRCVFERARWSFAGGVRNDGVDCFEGVFGLQALRMTMRPKQPHSARLWRHHLEPSWGFLAVRSDRPVRSS